MVYPEQLEHAVAQNTYQPSSLQSAISDKAKRLSAALARIPHRERLILSLLHHEPLSICEIAAVLDLETSDVLLLHASVIVQLRTLLAS